MLFAFFSCQKHRSSTDSKSQEIEGIMSVLNSGDYQEAYNLSQDALARNPNDTQMLYWNSQALAGLGELDIYSLFPVIKMKLFDVAISEWGEMQKFSERNREQTSSIILGDSISVANPNEEKDDLDRETARILRLPNSAIDYQIIESYKNTKAATSTNEDNYCFMNLLIDSKLFVDHTAIWLYNFPAENCSIEYGSDLQTSKLREMIRQFAVLKIENKRKKYEENYQQQKYLKIAFVLFEAIPILKRIPYFKVNKKNYLKESVSGLQKIIRLEDPQSKIYNHSKQQIGLIAGHFILGPIKNSVDFNGAKNALDLVCKSNVKIFLRHYEDIYYGVTHLIQAIEGSEFYIKHKKLLEMLDKQMKILPKTLEQEEQDKIESYFNKLKNESC